MNATLNISDTSFHVTHFVILNVILYPFYEWNKEKQMSTYRCVKPIQNDVQDNEDAKWSS